MLRPKSGHGGATDLSIDPMQGVPGFLEEQDFQAIVRGTSENVLEPNIEDIVSEAAISAGIPVFVVEDFPGD